LHIEVYGAESLLEDISLPLVQLLATVIRDGGSMGFLVGVTDAELMEFWSSELSKVRSGVNVLVCAMDASTYIGAGILTRETKTTGRHRAEVRKLMTRPEYRRKGVASQILTRIEAIACDRGVLLLTLRAEAGTAASVLYSAMGWILAGNIPNYAAGPDGSLHSVSFYFKELSPQG
jgi:GNAT superfamily N-acetyltransferase